MFSYPLVFYDFQYLIIEKAVKVFRSNTRIDIVIYGYSHPDPVTLTGAKAAGQCNIIVKIVIRNCLLKQFHDLFRPF